MFATRFRELLRQGCADPYAASCPAWGSAVGLAGGYLLSSSLSSDPPEMPDPNVGTISAAQSSERVANRQLDLAEEQFQYSKQRNSVLDQLAQTVINRQLEISDANFRDYNDYKRYYQTYIQPVEKSIVMDAIGGGYLTDAEMDELQGAFRNAEVARINAQYSGGATTMGNAGVQITQQLQSDPSVRASGGMVGSATQQPTGSTGPALQLQAGGGAAAAAQSQPAQQKALQQAQTKPLKVGDQQQTTDWGYDPSKPMTAAQQFFEKFGRVPSAAELQFGPNPGMAGNTTQPAGAQWVTGQGWIDTQTGAQVQGNAANMTPGAWGFDPNRSFADAQRYAEITYGKDSPQAQEARAKIQALPGAGATPNAGETREQITARIRADMEREAGIVSGGAPGAGSVTQSAIPTTTGAAPPPAAAAAAQGSPQAMIGAQNWALLPKTVQDAILADPNFAQKMNWSKDLSSQFDQSTLQGLDMSTGQMNLGGTKAADGITGWGAGNQYQPIGPMLGQGDDLWIDGWREKMLPNAVYDPTYGLMVKGDVANPLRKTKGNFFYDTVVPVASQALIAYGVGQGVNSLLTPNEFVGPPVEAGPVGPGLNSGSVPGLSELASAAPEAIRSNPTLFEQFMNAGKQALQAGKPFKTALQIGMAAGSLLGGKSPQTSTAGGTVAGAVGGTTTTSGGIDEAELNRRVNAEIARQTGAVTQTRTGTTGASNEANRQAALQALDLDESVQDAIRIAQKRAETNAVNMARSDNAASLARARSDNARYMAGLNLRPDAGRFAAINAELMNQGTAMEDTAVNAARDAVKNKSWTQRLDVSSLGRNLPANQTSTSQVASQTGSAAQNAATQNNASVLQNSQSALPWFTGANNAFNTSGALGNSVFGQQSSNYRAAMDAWQNNNQAAFGAAGTIFGAMK